MVDLRVWLLAPLGVAIGLVIGSSWPLLAGLVVLIGVFVPFAYTYFSLVRKAAGPATGAGRPLEEGPEGEA
jgi:hypothetical protein